MKIKTHNGNLQWTKIYKTHLSIACDVSHKVNRTLFPLTNPLQVRLVRRTQQKSVALLILCPPQLQNTQRGVAFLHTDTLDKEGNDRIK